MRTKIRHALLKGLLWANGTPMSQDALIGAGMTVFPSPTRAEVESVIAEMETKKLITGADNEALEVREWILTTRGKLMAQQL